MVATSTSGTSWTQATATLASGSGWVGVTYGGGNFVTVTYGNDKVAYSSDGITWATVTIAISNWDAMAYGNGRFVIVGNGDKTTRSNNATGTSWSTGGTLWTAGSFNIAYGSVSP